MKCPFCGFDNKDAFRCVSCSGRLFENHDSSALSEGWVSSQDEGYILEIIHRAFVLGDGWSQSYIFPYFRDLVGLIINHACTPWIWFLEMRGITRDEIADDVFLKVVRGDFQVKDLKAFKHFIGTVTINAVKDMFRSAQPPPGLLRLVMREISDYECMGEAIEIFDSYEAYIDILNSRTLSSEGIDIRLSRREIYYKLIKTSIYGDSRERKPRFMASKFGVGKDIYRFLDIATIEAWLNILRERRFTVCRDEMLERLRARGWIL